jgi:hypothetical protein
MTTETRCLLLGCAASILLAIPSSALAQGVPISIKPGLWESQSTVTNTMTLPPEVQAKIASMPPAQQAQMRAMMPGGGGGKPMTVTSKSCIESQMTLDGFLNQQQQRSGMKCNFTNRVQTADGAAFDTSCTMAQGTGSGHTEIHVIDDGHVKSSTHMTIDNTSQGHPMHMTADSSSTTTYLGAECGDVKPYTPPAGH